MKYLVSPRYRVFVIQKRKVQLFWTIYISLFIFFFYKVIFIFFMKIENWYEYLCCKNCSNCVFKFT